MNHATSTRTDTQKEGSRVREIFAAALARPTPEERQRYVAEACGADESLRALVLSLLEAHQQAGTFLDEKTVREEPEPSREGPGAVIGRYKLREKIGEGGCGIVYVAEQEEPVRRKVALKVIKLGMDTKSVVARFGAERQALAMMDHPNIAKVLDAGATVTGRPYFVMELVRGIRVTDYCDQNRLSTRQRLDLFIQVCNAVQHAHQKGIIHRDLKPSNILVTLHDGVPVPKVIDFGIAKATEGRLTDLTVYTELHQFIGTPAYMSPEQAEMSGLDIDTRSDIYSLGVLLYELLVGKTPFDAKELLVAGLDEMRRTICEKEPVRPSTRLNSLDAEEKTTTAKRRGVDVPKLLHTLRGDLDWIVMKALEKDRTRRYETANGLALDIKRHLGNETVLARPPSKVYRFQKLIRRNKLAFAATGAVAATLVLGIVASSVEAIRAEKARERAEQASASETQQRKLAEVEQRRAEAARAKEAEQRRLLRRHAYVADMGNAYQAVKDGNLGKATTLVERHLRTAPGEEDLRGFEWRYLWERCQPSAHEILARHERRPNCAVFSPDGKTLAIGGYDNQVTVLEIVSRKVLTKLEGFDGFIDLLALTFSRHGRLLAAKGGSQIRVWSTDDWHELFHSTKGNPNWNNNNAVVISPDNATLATRITNAVAFWDLQTGQQLHDQKLPGHPPFGDVMQLGTVMAYSLDGKMLAVSEATQLQLRDAHSLSMITNLTSPSSTIRVMSVAFSTNLVAAGFRQGELKLWELNTWREAGRAKAHTSFLVALCFSPDGALLATGGSDSVINIWSVSGLLESGPHSKAVTPVATLNGHVRSITSVMFSADGQTLASASYDGTIRLWRLRGVSETGPRVGPRDVLWFSSDGKRLITSENNTLYLWNTTGGLDRRTINLPTVLDEYSHRTISDDGKTLAVERAEGKIELWNLDTYTLSAAYEENDPVEQIRFSPDARLLVSAHERSGIKIRNSVKREKEIVLADLARPFAISPDGRILATHRLNRDGIQLSSLADRRPLDLLPLTTGVLMRAIAFSPDGKWLAAVSDSAAANAAVVLWDLSSKHATEIPVKEKTSVSSLAFAPDGKTLVVGTTDNDVLFWNVATREEIMRDVGNWPGGYSYKFSSNGEWLATPGKPSADGSEPYTLWHAPSFAEIDAIEAAKSARK